MIPLGAVDIDWHALGKAAYVSAVAGVLACVLAGVAVVCSLLAARARERSDGGGAAVATGYLVVTGACVIALGLMVVYGIYLLQK